VAAFLFGLEVGDFLGQRHIGPSLAIARGLQRTRAP
jgi:hypothetical protein